MKHYAARIKMCSEPPYLPTSAETLATKNSRPYHNTRRDAINGFLPITSHERINILRHSRRFFRCACKALLPAAP
ncbi:TPA: hypothetical protein G8N70_004527 [Salmonella enterica]|uniref:Uncharacterized protein n=1 Tax=Salmonella enterica TaxID=28901 RepID=A0A743PWA6_SALER|nr:hypothetical protein [Salmonella enterica subsp. enterica serovar Pomona]HAF2158273.1 hypothetical protein [Salmonella enterica]HAF2414133.1 hypothetical protein [Salmonella enterica]HAF4921581.1 hypothetical protein [Salmonella enterica]